MVAPEGPRGGFWARRIAGHERDPELGWHAVRQSEPGLLEIDADGMQACLPSTPARRVVLGGSVAFGGTASRLDLAWFALLGRSLEPHASAQALQDAYAAMRAGLDARGIDWVDASRAFEGEQATTFSDLWHFADPGQALLADLLAEEVGRRLR